MDTSSVSIPQSPVSSEGGRSSDGKANTIPRFECPPTFKQVEISLDDEPLYLEDVQEAAELWLIKAPHNFDAKKLSKKTISLSGRKFLDENDESDVGYELLPSQTALSDKGLPHLLLPSRNEATLVPAQAFEGELSVMETVAIPPVLLPPSPPKRSYALPPGLKQRFLPFGWEEPRKLVFETEKSVDVTGSSGAIPQGKPKNRKSSKDKKGKETRASASSSVGRGEGEVDDERLPRVGEAGTGDEEDGGVMRREHRKSKKRKKEHEQKEDPNQTEVTSEEKRHKKKKKHKSV